MAEGVDDLHRRRQDPELENASFDPTDIATITRPNEVTEYKVRVGGDWLDELRFGECSLKCPIWDNRAHTAEHSLTIRDDSRQNHETQQCIRTTTVWVIGNHPSESWRNRYVYSVATRGEQATNATATDVQHGRLHIAQSKLRNKRQYSS